jgi:hypothetical protein
LDLSLGPLDAASSIIASAAEARTHHPLTTLAPTWAANRPNFAVNWTSIA